MNDRFPERVALTVAGALCLLGAGLWLHGPLAVNVVAAVFGIVLLVTAGRNNPT